MYAWPWTVSRPFTAHYVGSGCYGGVFGITVRKDIEWCVVIVGNVQSSPGSCGDVASCKSISTKAPWFQALS